MVDVANAGNTLQRIVENVINDLVVARPESFAATTDSGANDCSTTTNTHRIRTVHTDRGQHLG